MSQRYGRVSLQSPELGSIMWKMWAERRGMKHSKGKEKMLGTKIFTLKILASKTVSWLEKFWVTFLTDCTIMPSTKSSSSLEEVLIEWLQNCFRSIDERCRIGFKQIINILIKNMNSIPMKMTPNTKDMPSILLLIFATRAFNTSFFPSY